jgi:DNA uptake protein ComE-like DNA-binding protein
MFSKWFSGAANRLAKQLNPRQMEIRTKLVNDPYCRLETTEEIAIAHQLGIKIDVNRASLDDWLRLPGISIHQGRQLVELVEMGMQFLCLEDLAAALSIPVARLQPLAPVLFFCYYDPESLITPSQLNPNVATLEQLQQLPIIERSLAQAIINNRNKQGSYRNLADLQRRLKLDSQVTSQLMYYFKFS